MESAVSFIVFLKLSFVSCHLSFFVSSVLFLTSFKWKHIFLCTIAGIQKSLKQKHGKNVDLVNGKLLPIKLVLKLFLNLINDSVLFGVLLHTDSFQNVQFLRYW